MIAASLPPLKALRAFEVAARHLSVKVAADELCVTPGAVSQMIKALEVSLGIRLFERANRTIVLTEAGRTYLPPIRNAFRQIAEASARVAAATETGALTLSVTPFFASAWLVPRLAAFHDDHPDIDVQVKTSNAPADFGRDGVDVAIRHGLGRYPGLASDHVVAVEIVPVATPALVARHGRPKTAADLARWPHVHDAERKGWQTWLAAQGLADIGPPRGPSYDDSSLLLQAVLAGQGAGLLPAALVARDIDAGRLVALADEALIDAVAYYLVCPEAARDRPKIAAFRDWILKAAAGPKTKAPKKKTATARRQASSGRSCASRLQGPGPAKTM